MCFLCSVILVRFHKYWQYTKSKSSREANQFIQQFPSDNLHTSVVRVALRVHDFQSRAVSPMFMVYWPKTKSKKKYKTATTHFPKQPLTLNYLVWYNQQVWCTAYIQTWNWLTRQHMRLLPLVSPLSLHSCLWRWQHYFGSR